MGIAPSPKRLLLLAAGGAMATALLSIGAMLLQPTADEQEAANGPNFVGETIHYRAVVREFAARDADNPFNDETLHGQVWVYFDERGEPELAVGRYRMPDGSLARLIRNGPEGGTVYWGRAPATEARECKRPLDDPLREGPLKSTVPAHRPPSLLHAQGYVQASEPDEIPEMESPELLEGIESPSIDQHDETDLQTWHLHEEAGGFFTDHAVTIDSDSGLIVAYHVTTRNERFEIIREYEWARGPLAGYDASDVPPGRFDLEEDEVASILALCEGQE